MNDQITAMEECVTSMRALAGVIRQHGTCAPAALESVAAKAEAAIALMRGQSWQDIATAPKDGTEILMTNGEVVHEGHWFNDEGGTVEHRDLDGKWIGQDDSDGFDGWIDWGGGMIPAPTHWQPLPAPKDTADEQ